MRPMTEAEKSPLIEFVAAAGTQAEAARLMGPGAPSGGTISNVLSGSNCTYRLRERFAQGVQRGWAELRRLRSHPEPGPEQGPARPARPASSPPPILDRLGAIEDRLGAIEDRLGLLGAIEDRLGLLLQAWGLE